MVVELNLIRVCQNAFFIKMYMKTAFLLLNTRLRKPALRLFACIPLMALYDISIISHNGFGKEFSLKWQDVFFYKCSSVMTVAPSF